MNHPATYQGSTTRSSLGSTLSTHRVLRNTYALLSMTLLFSAAVAGTAVALRLPAPGLILTLAGYFGLLFLVHKVQNSGWALGAVFALTGFMGYTLGPVLSAHLALPGGGHTIALALGATGATFLALSGWVLATRRDFSFMGGFLFAGMVIALLASLAAMFLHQTTFMGVDVRTADPRLVAGLLAAGGVKAIDIAFARFRAGDGGMGGPSWN